jgi:uncharacterized protein (DUF1501 family)
MDVTRRRFLRGAATLAGLGVLGPVVGRAGAAFAEEPAPGDVDLRRRLVLINLDGGNDGLNTVVPADDVSGLGENRRKVYEKVRGSLAVPLGQLQPHVLGDDGDGPLALNPNLPTLKALWDAGRVSIVQGVDYPKHNYSHFVSGDIWQSGDPDRAPKSGWLGRHLDRVGVGDTELRAIALGPALPLSLTGATEFGAQLLSLPPAYVDGTGPNAVAVHEAYAGFAAYPATEHPLRGYYGAICGSVGTLVDATSDMTLPSVVTEPLVRKMVGARALLEEPGLGVEIVTVSLGGFDTHANQAECHPRLLGQLDRALEAFFLGTCKGTTLNLGPLRADVAARTVVMTYSEFGRRIGSTLYGTDHGAAAPVFLVGPPPNASAGLRVKAGFAGAHPELGTVASPEDNLEMTTDFRALYQNVLTEWLRQPTDERPDEGDPLFAGWGPLDVFEVPPPG